MSRRAFTIRPEFSALGMKKPISPLLVLLIRAVKELRKAALLPPPKLAVEYGCGLLRNLKVLRKHFPQLCLVDTEFQLSRPHDFGGKRLTIPEYVAQHYGNKSVRVLTNQEFQDSGIRPDVVLSINVMDVVPADTRREMLQAIRRHLPHTGFFASLVPRNDSHTLHLYGAARRYGDGNVIPKHGAFLFYRNWSHDSLARFYETFGFYVVRDVSRYRYSCLVCTRTKPKGVQYPVSQ